MKILAFAASLREKSLNRKLIAVAADVARTQGTEVELAEFRDFELPIYDGDLNENKAADRPAPSNTSAASTPRTP